MADNLHSIQLSACSHRTCINSCSMLWCPKRVSSRTARDAPCCIGSSLGQVIMQPLVHQYGTANAW